MKLRSALLFFILAFPVAAQYAGPAILSRGEAPSDLTLPEIRFVPHISVSATYDTGLANTIVSNSGQIANFSSTGYTVAWGVSGNHHWRHTNLGLDYSGSVNFYAQQTAYNSINQNLLFSVGHTFSKHLILSLRESAGIFSRNYVIGGLSETTPFDPSTSYIPNTDYFDNRTIYVTTAADLTIQKSRRLSFNLGAQSFINNRESHALASAWGVEAQGDVQYRVSRMATVGVLYQYLHFGYSQTFGGTDVHGVAGSYSVRLSKFWEASGYAGWMRVESKFIQSQPVDPVIAILLGITSAPQVRHTVVYSPRVAGRLARTFRRGVAYVSGGRGVTAGNGLFLTSLMTTVFGGYSYNGFRRWSLNAQVGYMSATSEGNIEGTYGSTVVTVSAGRSLGRYVNMTANYSRRRYDSPQYANYNRWIDTAVFTLGFSPGVVRLAAR